MSIGPLVKQAASHAALPSREQSEAPARRGPASAAESPDPAAQTEHVEAPTTVMVDRVTPVTRAEPSAFAKVLAGLGDAASRGEHDAGRAMTAGAHGAGRDMSAAELLSLQASVYRYSEVIDLASKLVDRATTGVKTVVQGQ